MSIAPVSSLPTAAPAPLPVPSATTKPASVSSTAAVSASASVHASRDSKAPAKAEKNAEESRLSPEQAQRTVEALNKQVPPMSTAVTFSVDNDSGRTVIKVMDTEKNEMIRQIPSKEALALSQALDATNKGMILNTKA